MGAVKIFNRYPRIPYDLGFIILFHNYVSLS